MSRVFKKEELKEMAKRCLSCFYDGSPITNAPCKKCIDGETPDGWKPKDKQKLTKG